MSALVHLAETKYSYEAYLDRTRQACAYGGRKCAAGCGRRCVRVSRAHWRCADHYSYSVYTDAAMAETFEAPRFSGPIGRMLAETQEQVIASFFSPVEAATFST